MASLLRLLGLQGNPRHLTCRGRGTRVAVLAVSDAPRGEAGSDGGGGRGGGGCFWREGRQSRGWVWKAECTGSGGGGDTEKAPCMSSPSVAPLLSPERRGELAGPQPGRGNEGPPPPSPPSSQSLAPNYTVTELVFKKHVYFCSDSL